jgi:ABC-type nitrate/sulfonate/bicarbonate transport system substrate-binding protein
MTASDKYEVRPKRPRVVAAVAFATGMAIALAACGGSKGGTASTTSATAAATSKAAATTSASVNGAASSAGPTTNATTVRLGILSANIDPTLLSLLSGDYFQKVGLSVKIVRFDSGVPQVAAMVSGDIDIGYLAVSPLTSIAARGTDVKAIALAYTGGTQAVVVKPQSGINSIADLKGKKVGYVRGSIQEYAMQQVLAQKGLNLSDVQSVNVPVALMAAAYQKGSVDAEMAAQASLVNVLSSGAKILVRPEDVPGAGISGVTTYAIRGSFLQQHPKEAQLFVEAIDLARQGVASDPASAAKLLESQAGVSASAAAGVIKTVVTPSLKDLTNPSYPYNLTAGGLAKALQPVVQFMLKNSQIPKDVAPDSMVDGSVVTAAAAASH